MSLLDSIQQEVALRADSPEGMERLVNSLLASLLPLESEFLSRLKSYIRAKRMYIRRIRETNTLSGLGQWAALEAPGLGEVERLRSSYREVQWQLEKEVGMGRIKTLKRQEGLLWSSASAWNTPCETGSHSLW
jgi:hypothetical protein